LASQLSDGEVLLPPETLSTILGRQRIIADYFNGDLTVFNKDGVLVAENRYVKGRLGTSYADRSHFREALKTRQPYISRPVIGRTTGALLVSFLYPVRNDQGDF